MEQNDTVEIILPVLYSPRQQLFKSGFSVIGIFFKDFLADGKKIRGLQFQNLLVITPAASNGRHFSIRIFQFLAFSRNKAPQVVIICAVLYGRDLSNFWKPCQLFVRRKKDILHNAPPRIDLRQHSA